MRLDKIQIIGLAVVAIAILLLGWWVSEPWRVKAANTKAVEQVTTTSQVSTEKGAAAAVVADEKAGKRIGAVQQREAKRTPHIAGSSPDRSYDEFVVGMCESRLYADDPQCRGRRGNGGPRNGIHGGP